MFGNGAAGFFGVFKEEFGREQSASNNVPAHGMANKVQGDEVGVDPKLGLMARAQSLTDLRVDPMSQQSVHVVVLGILMILELDRERPEKECHKVLIEIEPLITAGHTNFQVVGESSFGKTAGAIFFVVIENARLIAGVVVVTGPNHVAFRANRNGRIHDIGKGTADAVGVSIQIVELTIRRDEIVMVVADLEEDLVQVPQYRNARSIFKSAIANHIAQGAFLNRVLLQFEFIMEIDSEIADENIEC